LPDLKRILGISPNSSLGLIDDDHNAPDGKRISLTNTIQLSNVDFKTYFIQIEYQKVTAFGQTASRVYLAALLLQKAVV
jgi:hypothetical protein